MKPGLSQGIKKAGRGSAVLCLSLFLAVYAMAAVPALHRLAHDNARDARHECAVTLFAHGQVHCASPAVEWRQPAAFLVSSPLPPRAVFPAPDVLLLPSRGPPGFSASFSHSV